MREDAHLDTPELGDYVTFMDNCYGVTVEIEGEVTRVHKTTQTANIRSSSGALWRFIPFAEITVLSKAA